MRALSLPPKLSPQQLTDDPRLALAPRKRWRPAETQDDVDFLAVEEPLEIRLGRSPLAVLMRTPGHDEELAYGFALTEGIAKDSSQLERAIHCSQGEHGDNVISLIPQPSLQIDPQRFQRNFYTTSSCGVCGKRSIEQALLLAPPIESPTAFSLDLLRMAPTKLRAEQDAHSRCGTLHGAALMNTAGDLLCVREDVGRHNAVDKVVGWAARAEVDLSPLALIVSGRVSFEIVQKALFARMSCIVAVGGVSSLASDLAKDCNMTLAGFTRQDSMSIYSEAEISK